MDNLNQMILRDTGWSSLAYWMDAIEFWTTHSHSPESAKQIAIAKESIDWLLFGVVA